MQRSLAALARALIPWLLLAALAVGAVFLWQQLADRLYVDLSGLSMMAGIETLAPAAPDAAGSATPAGPCYQSGSAASAAPPGPGSPTPR
jgi:hypothetical protein